MRIFIFAALTGLVIASSANAQTHAQLYPAPRVPVTIADASLGTVIGTVHTKDGLVLKEIERAPRDGKPMLLVFHGNESSAMESVHWLAPLVREGYGIVAAEYREYGGNPGTASEAGLAQDADASLDRARALAGTSKLIVIGHSLGAGVAFGLAKRRQTDALVTVGAFGRLADVVSVEKRAALSDSYDNVGAIAALTEPLYLIHGTADDTVPFQQAEELRAAATRAKKAGALFRVIDAGHALDSLIMVMILRAVVAKLDSDGKSVSVTLPSTVTLERF